MKRKKFKKLKTNIHIILLLIVACIVSACNSRPFDVLSEQQMEDILYDIYIAESTIKSNHSIFTADTLLKVEFLQSIFNKHNTTEAEFDSSLVWYNANLDVFLKINDKLTERYALDIAEATQLHEQIKANSKRVDTTFLHLTQHYILGSALQGDSLSFMVDDRTQLNKSKRYFIDFLSIGVKEPAYPILSLNIECADTTFVYTDTIKSNGWFNLVRSAGRERVVSIYGNISLPDTTKNPILINGFSISQQKETRIYNN
ncbi:hypothetical protein M2138_001005 [Dysgonomonadaceae bacterium PH5-43]|nr:hypothetical protein [Dysgonomonadaceae bacterium PH5-43]